MSARHLAASLLCALLGCAAGPSPPGSGQGDAGGQGSAAGAVTGFPRPDALDALLEQPLPPESALAKRFRDVDEWQLAGPFPDAVSAAPRARGGALGAIVDDFVASRAGLVVATASMDCFARELGRFLVAERGMPAEALQHYAAGRCAVATAPPRLATFGWTTTRELDDEKAVKALHEEIEQRLRESVVGGPLELGVWIHADAGRVDLVVAMGERHVRVDAVPTVPAQRGRVEIRGELLRPAQWVGAAATRGRFEWSECEPQAGVKLPRFDLVCSVDPGDTTAWIALEYRAPERLLTRVGLSVLVRPQGTEERVFRRSPYAPAHVVGDVADLPAALTEVLNGVRADAGLRPLTLDAEQTRAAARMAPYYFAAVFGQAPESMAELVALGMLAGWSVDGIVQDGAFTWGWLVESLDVSRLLSDALAEPGARIALLSRDAERIAIGSVAEGGTDAHGGYLAVAVPVRRPKGEAWGRYVVLLLAAEPARRSL